jgi:flagellar hook-associated protein 2
VAIQSTGIGSNLDVNSLISKLMQVESQPLTSLAKKEASYQAKLSAYGTLNAAVSAFQSSLTSLNSPSTFQNLSATSGDASILSASTSSIATIGNYNVNVTKIAQSQSLSSTGQVSTTESIGSNASTTTVSFQFGTISGGTLTAGKYTGATYTQDPDQAITSITIDSTNNSLQGIRDAINTANIGVNASIVGDGSATPYHLVLNSNKTGIASSLKITSSGETGGTGIGDLLNYDPQAPQTFTEVITAQNAKLSVNGVDIESASNTISSAIQGVSLTVSKIGSTSLSISPNTSSVSTSITAFVKTYNDLNTTLSTLSSYDASTRKGGILLGDSTARSVQSQVRNALSAAVNGLGGDLTNLTQIGITFQKDGSLAINSSKLQSTITSRFSEVGGLFSSIGKASDSLSRVTGSTTNTKAGSYSLDITAIALQGNLTGDVNLNAGITISANTSLTVTIDGTSSDVNLAANTYTSTSLIALLQSSINGNSAFSAAGKTVSVSIDGTTGFLKLKSNTYGSISNVTLASNTGSPASDFTGSILTGTAGVNVAGTINGIGAVGVGQALTGAGGTDVDGLQVLVSGGAIGNRGSVYFSRGYAHSLNELLGNFLGGSGSIASTTDGVNRSIKDIGKQRDLLTSRLIDTEARYRAQFTALDRIISGLNNTSTFLTQQLAALTGTNKF